MIDTVDDTAAPVPASPWWDADLRLLPPRARYKLLAGLVVPRPIAFVSTVSATGVRNAAPYSFFNVFSEDPPVVALGIGAAEGGRSGHKDTLQNVLDTREFVVNLVDEALLAAMNVSATDFPPQYDEFLEAGLTPAPSLHVRAPRIAQSPAQLECRELQTLPLGSGNRHLVLGEVLHVHVRRDLIDPSTLAVDTSALGLVGRLSGSAYTRTRDTIDVPRLTFEAWRARRTP